MRIHLILLIGLLSVTAFGQNFNHKIGKSLSSEMERGNQHEVMVLMEEQYPIASVPNGTKAEKAEYVYQNLAHTADRSQLALSQYLDKQSVDHRSFTVVNALSLKADNDLIRALTNRSDIRKIINDPWFKAPLPSPQKQPSYRMADTTYGVKLIQADVVWEQGFTGQGVTVAGQDTGFDWDVEPLKNKYRGWNALDSTVDHSYHWHDAIHDINPLNNDSIPTPESNPCGLNSLEPCDDDNHGTHTMGTAVGGTAEDIIGVAPGANWIGCRSLERGWGKLSTYVECFDFFLAPTDLNGQNPKPELAPHVINNSWYCPDLEGCTPETWGVMETAMSNLSASGIFLVVSAGNEGPDCGTIAAPPGIFNSAFVVGAIAESKLIAPFSSRGPLATDSITVSPHVVAPGVDIRSVIRNDDFLVGSGTSSAGPHVAGLVALLISAAPEISGDVAAISHTINSTTQQKMSNQDCNDILGQTIPNAVYGHGIVNAADAVFKLIGVSGVTEESYTNKVNVFPNPTNSYIKFELKIGSRMNSVSISSILGEMLYQRKFINKVKESELDISSLSSGIYIYNIKTDTEIISGKLYKY